MEQKLITLSDGKIEVVSEFNETQLIEKYIGKDFVGWFRYRLENGEEQEDIKEKIFDLESNLEESEREYTDLQDAVEREVLKMRKEVEKIEDKKLKERLLVLVERIDESTM